MIMKLEDSPIAEEIRSLGDRTKAAVRYTDEYVHENPWLAIGTAVLAGLVVGLLVMPRSGK